MLLHQAGLAFTDNRHEYMEFQKIKDEAGDKFEFGEAPMLEYPESGETYCQTYSILRLLARQNGLYPEDPVAAWKVDSALDGGLDLQEKFWDLMHYEWKYVMNKDNQEKHDKELAEYLSKTVPTYLSVL